MIREAVARAIHAADPSHHSEPWSDVAGHYLAMAEAAIDAQSTFEADALRVNNARLRGALSDCVRIIDETIAESERAIECGEEDPFRMGDWLEDCDHESIRIARAALIAQEGGT